MSIQEIVLLQGGELSSDIAHQLESKIKSKCSLNIKVISMSKTKEFKSLTETSTATTLAIFIVQTIENELPPEDAGPCIRFYKRKTHPNDLLAEKFQFSVLGLGDSNLLLDRQHTAAKDCNQVAQALDARFEALGGSRFYDRGEADERTGLTEVDPWIDGLVAKLA